MIPQGPDSQQRARLISRNTLLGISVEVTILREKLYLVIDPDNTLSFK